MSLKNDAADVLAALASTSTGDVEPLATSTSNAAGLLAGLAAAPGQVDPAIAAPPVTPLDLVKLTTGFVTFLLLAAPPAAFALSVALLALYRRRLIRLMGMARRGGPAGAGAGAAGAAGPRLSNAPPALDGASPRALVRAAASGPRRAVLAYAAGVSAYAAWATGVQFLANGNDFLPVRTAVVFLVHVWPLVPIAGLLLAADRRTFAKLVASYAAALALLGEYAVMRSPLLNVFTPFVYWGTLVGPPTLAVAVMMQRRVRAIGPMALAFVVACLLGPNVALAVLADDVPAASALAAAVGVRSAAGALAVTALAGFVPFLFLGAGALAGMRRLYVRKRATDQTLIVDSVVAIYGLIHATSLAFKGLAWLPVGLGGVVAYKVAASLALRLTFGREKAPWRAPRLLYLRVFASGPMRERLFRAWSTRWRYVGTVRMIAGPDLATSTVEPHEFLDFVSGRMAARFVDGRPALDRALAAEDARRDPDGRFRVEDFFCYDDTWRMAFRRAAADCDVALMDLRGFSAAHRGAAFELQELAAHVSADRVVLVVDDATDFARLTAIVRAESAPSALPPRIVRFTGAPPELSRLLRELCEAACGARAASGRV